MYIINQTFSVENDVHDQWMLWMKEVYIPQVTKTDLFSELRLLKLVSHRSEDGLNYALQFSLPDLMSADKANSTFDTKFEVLVANTFGEKVLVFRTMLEEM